jgi:hypothetical protein
LDRSDELQAFLDKRGIDDEEVISDLFSDHVHIYSTRALFPKNMQPNQRMDLSKKLNWFEKVGGGIIKRTKPQRFPGPSLTPQLKPWIDPHGRKRVEYHGPPTDKPLVNPETGKPLHPVQIKTPKQRAAHIKGKWHKGVNSTEVDVEVDTKKYDFFAGPRVQVVRSHTHRKMYEENPEKLLNHLLKQHAFKTVPELDEPHPVRFSEKRRGDAARIDFPRLSEERLPYSRVGHCQHEGPTKAAAMLCAIREEDTPELVINVPAMGAADDEELARFVRLYPEALEMRWFIHVDADCVLKGEVMNHALDTLESFESLGMEADIALPDPQPWLEWDAAGRDPEKEPKIKAFDDLRAEGGKLDDLIVMGRRETPYGLLEFVNQNKSSYSPTVYSNGARRDAELLKHLARRADLNGNYRLPPLRTIAKRLGWKDHKRVGRALESLTWGDPRFGGGKSAGAIDLVIGSYDVRRDHFSGKFDWKDAPVINVHPRLRAIQQPPWKLREARRQLRTAPEEETEESSPAAQVASAR